ncbi:SRPBCC family protein [Streptomyces peucetius]|nr:carbon monoxide dehydrogenase [Streptomyces peucetius subsp. caesius ATCC 27952]
MEHEVFVPVPAETVREALRDPARVARCVPGLQRDADESAGPLSGRLRVRVAGHTITYRGALHITEQDDERGGAFSVEGEGAEARGGGSVKLTLTIRPAPTDGGTTVTFTGSAHAEGRLADLAAGAKVSAAQRLLDRFAAVLADAALDDPRPAGHPQRAEGAGEGAAGEAAAQAGPQGEVTGGPADRAPGEGRESGTEGTVDDQAQPGPSAEDSRKDRAADGAAGPGDEDTAGGADGPTGPDVPDGPGGAGDADVAGGSVFETPVPLPSLGPDADDEFEDMDDVDDVDDVEDLSGLPGAVPAEAAHARRTMIGRSAEEVDHAPPRGRYAPTPAPDAGSAGATLRWLAPAAALALASAVVVGRALRRRR